MDSAPIRVAIVEDQPLFRDLLKESLDQDENLEVAFAAGSVTEARAQVKISEVDVALLDVDLPDGNGIGLAVSLRRDFPGRGVVLLSANDELDLLLSLPDDVRRGWSYLSKSSTADLSILITAIQSSRRGITMLDPTLVGNSAPKPQGDLSKLTKKQFQVLAAVARGLGNQAIADEMGLSLNSIVNHLTAIYAALGIQDGANARVSAVLNFLENTTRTPR